MKILLASWETVVRETIVDCFKTAGINTEAQKTLINDSEDPFEYLQEGLDVLKAANPDMVPDGIPAESIADVDSDVMITASEITDWAS